MIHSGLTAVAFELEDTTPNGGGFGCIRGSHKTADSVPAAWRDLSAGVPPIVHRVSVPARSAIIFSEAVEHGTLPWAAAGCPRVTIFCKFTPCCEAYSGEQSYFPPREFLPADRLGGRTAAMLSPPPPEFGRTACAAYRRRQGEGAEEAELAQLQARMAEESAAGVHPPAARAPHASL